MRRFDPAWLFGLLESCEAEGYGMIPRLIGGFEDGSIRFDKPGEALYLVWLGKRVVGVGGVMIDDRLNDPRIARVRRVYILPEHRGKGAGKLLMKAIFERARMHFQVLVLKTTLAPADAFYLSLGFTSPSPYPETTHYTKF